MPTITALADERHDDPADKRRPGGQLSVLPELAREIRALIGVARASIVEIGEKLIAAKTQMEYGKWLPWLDREFGWNARTAQRYMQVAEAFSTKCDTVSYSGLTIDASALYALAAPKVPEDVRDEAIATAKAGTRVTRTVAQRLIKALKNAEVRAHDTPKVAQRMIEAPEPATAEDTDTDVVSASEDADAIDTIEADDDVFDDNVFHDRPPIPNDSRWQETMRGWINDRRDESILLADVIDRFAGTIPLHDATRRWHFDFEEYGFGFAMRTYALLISLRSLGVKFNPPLGRGLSTTPETEFTVPRRRQSRW
jgi:hypothetical protein